MNDQTRRFDDRPREELPLVQVVDELVYGWTTRERADRLDVDPSSPWGWRRRSVEHVVHHRSLLEQLGSTTTDGASGGERVERAAGPRAGARLDALAALQRVEVESRWWLAQLGSPVPASVESRLLELLRVEVLLRQTLDHRDQTLERAARGWRLQARVITNWDTPPWSPHVPCPEDRCDALDSLRVRLDTEAGTATAVCSSCGRTWTELEVSAGLGPWVAWATAHLGGHEHLVHDDDGELVTCQVCLPERNARADRERERWEAQQLLDRLARATARAGA